MTNNNLMWSLYVDLGSKNPIFMASVVDSETGAVLGGFDIGISEDGRNATTIKKCKELGLSDLMAKDMVDTMDRFDRYFADNTPIAQR